MSESELISYRFELPDGSDRIFKFFFDPTDFSLINDAPSKPPFWTELAFKQCANCPLSTSLHTHCPVALQMVGAIEELEVLVSFDTVTAIVEQADRTVTIVTSAQQALASVFGLIMATAGCPWMDHLRPMARFHQPFASEAETLYRCVSMYALVQQAWRSGEALSFQPLQQLYDSLHIVNRDMSRRLGAATHSDPAQNAIALLDTFTTLLPDAIERSLQEFTPLFAAWKYNL